MYTQLHTLPFLKCIYVFLAPSVYTHTHLFLWLNTIHVYIVINSLYTNICSSLIQIGSRPFIV